MTQATKGMTVGAGYGGVATSVAGTTGGTGGFSGGTSIAGAVITAMSDAYTSYVQGQMAADTMSFNAKMAEIQGRMIAETAKLNANRYRKQGQSIISTQRALYAKAGVKSEGSPIEVEIDSMANIEYDALMIELEGKMGQAGKQFEATSYLNKGETYKEQANIKAGSTLLTQTAGAIQRFYSPKGK